MKFEPVAVAGAFLVHLAAHRDPRGFFARSWCSDTFRQNGIAFDIVQANFSYTQARGTIRGMHYQSMPHPDAKIVRCSRGRIFEVVADVRPGSSTYGLWWSTELAGESCDMVYVPPGCAQGFQSLTDDAVVEYFMGERFHPEAYRGFRYDDPSMGIRWPLPPGVVSAQDRAWPDLPSTGRIQAVTPDIALSPEARVAPDARTAPGGRERLPPIDFGRDAAAMNEEARVEASEDRIATRVG